MKITANEIYVQEGGARIRTRCPKIDVTDTMVSWAAAYSKLDAGDLITVQCMSHERDTVYWQRQYVVASRRDYLKRTENDHGDVNHADAFDVKIRAMHDWLALIPEEVAAKPKVTEKAA